MPEPDQAPAGAGGRLLPRPLSSLRPSHPKCGNPPCLRSPTDGPPPNVNPLLPPAAQIIYDKETGRSKGFCFVSFEDEADASEALNDSNGRCGAGGCGEGEGSSCRMSGEGSGCSMARNAWPLRGWRRAGAALAAWNAWAGGLWDGRSPASSGGQPSCWLRRLLCGSGLLPGARSRLPALAPPEPFLLLATGYG